jgi:4-carboxymuconolactone decarboxylase
MPRIDVIPLEKMTPGARRFHDGLVTKKGRPVSGPWIAFLHAPEIGERLASVVEYFNSDTRVPHTLKGIAILTVARAYTAQYEWYIHEKRARAAGLDAAVIDAIRSGARPAFRDPSEALVYDLTSEVLKTGSVSDDLRARAVSVLGQAAVLELVAQIGFYIAVAIVVVTYDVETADGTAPLPVL